MPYEPVSASLRAIAKALRKDMTDAERAVWYAVRAHRLEGLSFRRQYPVAGYITDFACPSARLIVEIDGPVHDTAENRERDDHRDAALAKAGWKVLRFTNLQATTRLNEVRETILEAARRGQGARNDR